MARIRRRRPSHPCGNYGCEHRATKCVIFRRKSRPGYLFSDFLCASCAMIELFRHADGDWRGSITTLETA